MVSYGRAEYQQVFDREGQIEISKFDKEARQDYNLILPKREYNNYTTGTLRLQPIVATSSV
jgi:hypothetical protein